MKLEEFESGEYHQQYQYQSFTPSLINREWVWEDSGVNLLLEQATQRLGELNAFSLIVPDIDLFIEMYVVKEASQSSRIEGTQTEIDEALMGREQIAPDKRDDWQEVQNYIEAMNYALSELERLPLCVRLLKQTHAILMQGVRGEHKTPGEFRVSQNWIGGSNLQNAVFVPPHQGEVVELISDLEKFWHNDQVQVPHLIKAAISHYQFETIHPFLDGNGRIGRLLITLYLVSNRLLHKPSLYLSDFFEKNRGAYYDALTTVRSSHDLLHWVKFFLTAVIETAEKGKFAFGAILELRQRHEAELVSLGRRAENGRKLLLQLYRKPVLTGKDIATHLSITPRAANGLIDEFVAKGILVEETGYRRNRVFVMAEYLELFWK